MKNTYIPRELTEEILMKLPVKSLVSFKCVRKEWNNLISDPEFAERHFKYGQRTEKLMITTSDVNHFKSINPIKSLHDESSCQSLSLSFLGHRHPKPCVQIKGSCRGFLLLESCRTLYLWNPSTGQNKMIQWSSNVSFITPGDSFLFCHGLGYDPRTKDYVVVVISFAEYDSPSHMECFSVKENAWIHIQLAADLHYKSCKFWTGRNNLTGTFFNNALHWFVYNYEAYMHVVLAFDLVGRTFSEIHVPNEFEFKMYCQPHALNVVGGSLCLCVTREMGQVEASIQIWELKQYTDHTSWTKTNTLIINDIWFGLFLPICNAENGCIVGSDHAGVLVKWNQDGEVEEQRSFDYIRDGYQVIAYRETLFTI
ncbi:hypothetical protein JHK82_051782 [Glycine max]|nr:hypothetical protein JHK82_051782 [Glycine max]